MSKKFKKGLLELFDCGGSSGGLYITEVDQEMLCEEIQKLVEANGGFGDVVGQSEQLKCAHKWRDSSFYENRKFCERCGIYQ